MTSGTQAETSPTRQMPENPGKLALDEMLNRADQLLGASGRAMPGHFEFKWKEIAFFATPEQPDAAESVVIIKACLGRLPYTAEDAAARRSVLELADGDLDDLPGELKIDKDSKIHLTMRTGPIRADGLAGLLKEVTCHVLEAAVVLKQLRGLLRD